MSWIGFTNNFHKILGRSEGMVIYITSNIGIFYIKLSIWSPQCFMQFILLGGSDIFVWCDVACDRYEDWW